MTEAEEKAYVLGQQMLASRLLQELLLQLDDGDTSVAKAQMMLADTRSALCRLYDFLGLNEHWDNGVHLVDLVTRLEKLLPEGGDE